MKVLTFLFGIGAVTFFTAGKPAKAGEANATPPKVVGANSAVQLGITEAMWQRTAPPGEVVYHENDVRAYQSAGRYYYFKSGILVKVDSGLIPLAEIERLDDQQIKKDRADAEALEKQIVNQRFARAKELIKSGASAEALKELLWCYDEGMAQIPSMAAVRGVSVLGSLRDLGQSYRPAREALRARDEAIIQKVLAGDASIETARDLYTLDRALGLRRTGLGIYESTWERGESVYSESNLERGARGGMFPGAGRTEAFQAEDRYYYFKDGILVKTDSKRIPAKTINQIDARKIIRDYFAHPPLGANETDWRNMTGEPAYITVTADAFRWRDKYYHFKRGVLVRIDAKLIPASEIMRLDEQKLAPDSAARIGLGMTEGDWQRLNTDGEVARQETDLRVYHSGENYYHFKKGVLVAIDPKLIASIEIAKIDEQKILDANEPALGTPEGVVAMRWQPRLVLSGGDSIHVYRSEELYYYFRRGTLVKLSPEVVSPDEIAQLDLRKIFAEYLGNSPIGMSHSEWRRPLVYNENGVKAYRTADVYQYFKKSILVKIDPALISSQEIGQLDEMKFLAANLRTPPKEVPLPKAPSSPFPAGPPAPLYDRSQAGSGLGPEWERSASENMSRELPPPVGY